MKRFLFIALFIALAYGLLAFEYFAEPGQSGKNSELSFWTFGDTEEVLNPLLKGFEKTHSGLTVKLQSWATLADYRKAIFEALQNQKAPDIFVIPPDDFLELKSYMFPSGSVSLEGFPEITKQLFAKNAETLSVPWWADSLMLYYHKKYFPLGLKNSWNDFAEQLRGFSIGGIALGRFDNLILGWDLFKALLVQKSSLLQYRKKDQVWNETLLFFQRFADEKDRYFNWSENLSKYGPDFEMDSFVHQQVAAIGGYGSDFESILQKIAKLHNQKNILNPEDIGFAPFPQFDPKHPKYLTKFYGLGVSLLSSRPRDAGELLQYLNEDRQRRTFEFATGKVSAKLLAPRESDHPLLKLQKDLLKNARYLWIDEDLRKK